MYEGNGEQNQLQIKNGCIDIDGILAYQIDSMKYLDLKNFKIDSITDMLCFSYFISDP